MFVRGGGFLRDGTLVCPHLLRHAGRAPRRAAPCYLLRELAVPARASREQRSRRECVRMYMIHIMSSSSSRRERHTDFRFHTAVGTGRGTAMPPTDWSCHGLAGTVVVDNHRRSSRCPQTL